MSSEIILDNTKAIFKLDKEILSFKLNKEDLPKDEPTKSTITSNNKINVTNLTEDYLAFRTKTTKRLYYNVSPIYCIIPPKESKEINIQFIINEGEIPKLSGHKFKFEGFKIQEDEKDKDPKNLFIEYIQKSQPVIGNSQKTFVQFFDKNENEIKHKKSSKLLHLPDMSHERGGSDLSEYNEIDNEKNEIEKDSFLMEQIQSKEEHKPILSDILSGKIEENREEKKDELKNEKIQNEENMEKEYKNNIKDENVKFPIKSLLNEKKDEIMNKKYNINEKYGKNVSDALVIISLFIAMLVGYYLVK